PLAPVFVASGKPHADGTARHPVAGWDGVGVGVLDGLADALLLLGVADWATVTVTVGPAAVTVTGGGNGQVSLLELMEQVTDWVVVAAPTRLLPASSTTTPPRPSRATTRRVIRLAAGQGRRALRWRRRR